jgi:hypothetical protein
MVKRIITPHKGGRTEDIKFRATPEEKERIMKAKGDLPLCDFILKLIKKSR